MKKVISLILFLCFVFCFGLASCGNKEPEPGSKTTVGGCSENHIAEVIVSAYRLLGSKDEYAFWSAENVMPHNDETVAPTAVLSFLTAGNESECTYKHSRTDMGNAYQTDVYESENVVYEINHKSGEIIGYRAKNEAGYFYYAKHSGRPPLEVVTNDEGELIVSENSPLLDIAECYLLTEIDEYTMTVTDCETFYAIKYERPINGVPTAECLIMHVEKESFGVSYFAANMIGRCDEEFSPEIQWIEKEAHDKIREKITELYSENANFEIQSKKFSFNPENPCIIYEVGVSFVAPPNESGEAVEIRDAVYIMVDVR